MSNLSNIKEEYKNMKPHLTDGQRKDMDKYVGGADMWNRVRVVCIVTLVGGLAYLAIIS